MRVRSDPGPKKLPVSSGAMAKKPFKCVLVQHRTLGLYCVSIKVKFYHKPDAPVEFFAFHFIELCHDVVNCPLDLRNDHYNSQHSVRAYATSHQPTYTVTHKNHINM